MPSNCFWRGDALAIQEVKTLVVGGVAAAGQIYTATMNGKSVSYTAILGDTNATIATELSALLSSTNSVPPEFNEAGYTDSGTGTITMTANSAGVPLTITTSATGTGTFVTTTTTAATGPNFWDNAGNWDTGTVPVTGDSVYLRKSSVDILYGTDQSGVTLALLDVDGTYTGKIGLPDFNANGYVEYRNTFLKISATTAYCGRGTSSGPGRFRWNVGANQTTFKIYGTGTPDDGTPAAIEFVGTHASNSISVQRGTLAIGLKPTTAATVLTLAIGSRDNPNSDAAVYCGYNVTLGTLNQNGGTVEVWNGLTTANLTDGTLNAYGGAFTTINNDSGTVNYDTSGTCGTYTGGTNSLLDCSRVSASRTFTTASFNANSSFRDPAKTVTFGGSGATIRCKLSELREFDIGENFLIQRN